MFVRGDPEPTAAHVALHVQHEQRVVQARTQQRPAPLPTPLVHAHAPPLRIAKAASALKLSCLSRCLDDPNIQLEALSHTVGLLHHGRVIIYRGP